MPRLLLVDDNPSIHRIAESLLAPTSIELVCVDSAVEALDRIRGGERFDAALVDTAMPGMDGWALVERLRATEEAARMPIALMAGVLDPVDPQKLELAPIQGFLKKPIELRELADRVNTLMVTPVDAPMAPMESRRTQPISHEEAAAAIAAFPEYTPTLQLPDEEEVLVLTAGDVWSEAVPELPAVQTVEAFDATLGTAEDLELEELDLEGLQSLTAEMAPPAPPMDEPTRETPPLPQLETFEADELASLLDADLGGPPAPPVAPAPEIKGAPMEMGITPPPMPPEMEVEPEPAALPEMPMAAVQGASDAIVQAIVADPQAMDKLAKALLARLGEEQLKALAWEVFPDLAKKLS